MSRRTWSVPALADEEVTTLTITALVTSTVPQTNNASITSAGEFDQNPENNSASATETPQIADLAVTKVVNNNKPNLNDTITFTVTVVNNGPNTAIGVVVTDPIPAGLGGSVESTSVGSYNPFTGIWTFDSLAAGAMATLTMTGQVTTTNGVTNTATAHATQFDPNLSNNSATAVAGVQTADLVLQKIAPATAQWKAIAAYTFIIHDNGPNAAQDVVVHDPYPSSLQFVSVQSVSQGAFNPATGDWTVGTLQNGQTATLVVNFLVQATGVINNVATASAITIDPDLNNNVSSTSVFSTINPASVTKGRLLASSVRSLL